MENMVLKLSKSEEIIYNILSNDKTAKMLLEPLKTHSVETYIHSFNVASISSFLAEEMGINESGTKIITLGALLHDVGKISVPRSILEGSEKLNPKERAGIELHPMFGYLLTKDRFHERVQDICLHHHEKLNGSGYPDGISQIHYFTQIVTVADMYNAMISSRAYKKTLSHDEAIKELMIDVQNGKLNQDIVDVIKKYSRY